MSAEREIVLRQANPVPHPCVIEKTGDHPETWSTECLECDWHNDGWTAREHAADAVGSHNKEVRWVDDDGQEWVLRDRI